MLRRETRAADGLTYPSSPHLDFVQKGCGADPGPSAWNAARWAARALLCPALAASVLGSGASDVRTPPAPTASTQRSVLASSASANVPLSAPVLGFVWDGGSSSLRRVEGVPGAALVGTSFFRGEFAAAAVAPNQAYALFTGADGDLYFSALPGIKAPELVATGLPTNVRISFSPTGDSAVLYSPTATSTFLATGLNTAPVVREVPSLDGISGIFSAIAGDSGAVLIARAGNSGVSVSCTSMTSALTPVTSIGQLGGMAFLAGTDAAVVSDSQDSNLWKVSGIGGAVNLTLIAGVAEGVSNPGALAISQDNRALWVTSQANTAIQEFLLTGSSRGPAKALVAPFPITGLARLNGNSVFALQGTPMGALFVLDGDWPTGRIVQVPITPLPPMLGGLE